ncbi:MAG: Asp-tRNA(Asn)/Glu-tRNA(Gln) amidotransferase subunit GatA [Planctomycetes bacterium]|nr:Asp-tRNA(Asn)/Glu-tRNA(Gln) amidotransferase subunit GatA [Planctomycetota bacterium]
MPPSAPTAPTAPTELTAHALRAAIVARRLSAREAAEAHFARMERVEPQVKAYLTTCREPALAAADAIDARIARGESVGPLAGVPVALKDNLCTRGVRTTCSSRILEHFVPTYDATAVERLRAAGAVTLGKTNLDEFAMGSSTENSAYGPSLNPWDVTRVPGGSSGGSAAAVAAGTAVAALGSDTGGSIRQPAALCGIVGLKPTYGRVSRFGLVAFASSLDQIGPLTRDVRDSALMLQAIAGPDPHDSTSAAADVPDFARDLEAGVKGLRLGIPKEYFAPGTDPEITRAVEAAIDVLRRAGAEVRAVSLPHTDYGIAAYYVVAPAEASSNLARYDGVRYGLRAGAEGGLLAMYKESRRRGFGREVARRIMLGTFALSSGYYDAYYNQALRVRRLIKRDFDNAFAEVDVVVCPTSPIPAFKVGEKAADPLQMYLADVFTVCLNMAGLPGISIPCGFTSGNLPIGLQLIGRPFDEPTVLRAARAYERETDWHERRPAGLA